MEWEEGERGEGVQLAHSRLRFVWLRCVISLCELWLKCQQRNEKRETSITNNEPWRRGGEGDLTLVTHDLSASLNVCVCLRVCVTIVCLCLQAKEKSIEFQFKAR